MCTIQSNQTLDALITYVAKFHILYSGQLEIRLSVFGRGILCCVCVCLVEILSDVCVITD